MNQVSSLSLTAVALLLFTTMAQTAEINASDTDQTNLTLTVYNDNLALIRDTRKITLPQGVIRLAFGDVSAQIRPETARLYGQPVVLEQNFDYDLLSPRKLLEKYVGREIGLIRTHPETGEDFVERGKLLSVAEEGIVFRFGNRIETGGPASPWRFVFDDVPENLRERPTLSMLLNNPEAGEQTVELAYLSRGLSWKADYVATLGNADGRMDLTGWVTLHNTSGATYRDAKLQLLAGDIGQVREERQVFAEDAIMARAAPAPMRRETLFEYHLYTLEQPTTIADRQTKQVSLMQAEQIPVDREYRIDTGGGYQPRRDDRQELSTQVILRFVNDRPALGDPLPAGIIRFYQRDGAGTVQFIGENRIDHTPEGRDIELSVGNAFDITATRRQTAFKKGPDKETEAAWEVTIFNAKAESVEVKVTTRLPGEWRVLEESLPHERESASMASWQVAVPAKGQMSLSYRIWMR